MQEVLCSIPTTTKRKLALPTIVIIIYRAGVEPRAQYMLDKCPLPLSYSTTCPIIIIMIIMTLCRAPKSPLGLNPLNQF